MADAGLRALARGCSTEGLHTLLLSDCEKLHGAGLAALREGATATSLTTLSLHSCTALRSRQAAALFAAGPPLQVLSLHRCSLIANDALAALADGCPSLVRLDLRRCRRVTDDGLRALARGLVALEWLDVAEVPSVGEEGVSALADGCTRLVTLDLTACPRVGSSFVRDLATELPFVRQAERWLGFEPLPEHRTLIAFTERWRIETDAAITMQRLARGAAARRRVQAMRFVRECEAAASRLQRSWRAYRARRGAQAAIEAQKQERSARRVQRVWRGSKGRSEARRLAAEVHALAARRRAAVAVQRRYRGLCGRREARRRAVAREEARELELIHHQQLVRAALRVQQAWRANRARGEAALLREARRQAQAWLRHRHAMATRVQARWRGLLGRRAAQARREELWRQQRREAAALDVQRAYRGMRGRRIAAARRAVRLARRREEAALKLQSAYRAHLARRTAMSMRALHALREAEVAAAQLLQRVWRGVMARQMATRIREEQELQRRRAAGALALQRVYRGHRSREEAAVRRAVKAIEHRTKPLRDEIQRLIGERTAVEADVDRTRQALRKAEARVQDIAEELADVRKVRRKYYDSDKLSGVPQRYLTAFLREALETRLESGHGELERLTATDDELSSRLKEIQRDLRVQKRELAPLLARAVERTRAERTARLRRYVRHSADAARTLQRAWRGARLRGALADLPRGLCYWVARRHPRTGDIHFLNVWTGERRWSEPPALRVWRRTALWRVGADVRAECAYYEAKVAAAHSQTAGGDGNGSDEELRDGEEGEGPEPAPAPGPLPPSLSVEEVLATVYRDAWSVHWDPVAHRCAGSLPPTRELPQPLTHTPPLSLLSASQVLFLPLRAGRVPLAAAAGVPAPGPGGGGGPCPGGVTEARRTKRLRSGPPPCRGRQSPRLPSKHDWRAGGRGAGGGRYSAPAIGSWPRGPGREAGLAHP